MGTRWKRNTVVAAMALLICAAVGLNWKFSQAPDMGESEEAGTKILGEAALVSGEDHAVEDDSAVSEQEAYTGSDYFASARLTRQQARDSALSMLQEAAEQEDASAAAADEASEGIQVLASYTLKESQIENLVTAKGYQDCVAFMGEDGVSIVVSTASGELTDADVAKIKDIAMTETGYEAEGIKIMGAN